MYRIHFRALLQTLKQLSWKKNGFVNSIKLKNHEVSPAYAQHVQPIILSRLICVCDLHPKARTHRNRDTERKTAGLTQPTDLNIKRTCTSMAKAERQAMCGARHSHSHTTW